MLGNLKLLRLTCSCSYQLWLLYVDAEQKLPFSVLLFGNLHKYLTGMHGGPFQGLLSDHLGYPVLYHYVDVALLNHANEQNEIEA